MNKDIFFILTKNLNITDILMLRCVCKHFAKYGSCDNQILWKYLVNRDYFSSFRAKGRRQEFRKNVEKNAFEYYKQLYTRYKYEQKKPEEIMINRQEQSHIRLEPIHEIVYENNTITKRYIGYKKIFKDEEKEKQVKERRKLDKRIYQNRNKKKY
jgi:hypothetical protein